MTGRIIAAGILFLGLSWAGLSGAGDKKREPIPTFTTTLGVGQPISIQLPRVTLQRVRTTVTMPDGGTIMLGGMKLAEKQDQVSGVPVLKDLPGLSFFFSRKGTFVQNMKILILIRAKIIMSEEYEPTMSPDGQLMTRR